jgi:GAF domain-containing protein
VTAPPGRIAATATGAGNLLNRTGSRADRRDVAVAARLRLIDALKAATSSLLDELDADGCAVSRALGDALVLLHEVSPDGKSLQIGGGFLLSEFPETAQVLRTGLPRSICVEDRDADPSEVRLLRELGFGCLLMLPLPLRGETWGLVELYRTQPRHFAAAEIETARTVLAALSRL